MPPLDAADPDLGPAPTVTRTLRDAANRSIIATLAEERDRLLDVAGLQARALPDAPVRFLRDRLRHLHELGIVERAPDGEGRNAGAAAIWVLTPAGRDLHRVYALIARIVTRAGAPRIAASDRRRERAVEVALDTLADPSMLRILGRLAAAPHPLDPDALEEACFPVTRRTLYRRLRTLQDEGLVQRLVTHEVPRRTHYTLQDRWRPVAGVLLLAGWWELRHGAGNAPTFDLPMLLHLVAPVAKVPQSQVGTTRWIVKADAREPIAVLVGLSDGGFQARDEAIATADADITGTPLAWAAALVTDDRSGLVTAGSAELADAAITGTRAALLAYVR